VKVAFIRQKLTQVYLEIFDYNKTADRSGDMSTKHLTYQLLTVRSWLTVAPTGNGELGFDSGEEA
jgi:hypothetical protein